jgi:16S rRNA (guanine527-N7)-methyltransferase
MGASLPEISEEEFRRRLARSVPRLEPELAPEPARGRGPAGGELAAAEVPERLAADLYEHYAELRRWNPRVSLVGPGTAADLVERHYGESLAALPLVRAEDRTLVDVGSGAGFPGLVLAAARRAPPATAPNASLAVPPNASLSATLIEPRQKKAFFLRAAARRIGLSCRCLDARVDASLPAGLPDEIDLVTSRALKVAPELFELFFRHSPRVRFLLWHGEGLPEVPRPLAVTRSWRLSGTDRRRILEIRAENRAGRRSAEVRSETIYPRRSTRDDSQMTTRR